MSFPTLQNECATGSRYGAGERAGPEAALPRA